MDALTCPCCQFTADQTAFDWDGSDEGDGTFTEYFTCPECDCKFDNEGEIKPMDTTEYSEFDEDGNPIA